MSVTAALATFAAILPAELPDKTILACLILSSRYRASYVFAGAAAAFAVHVGLAVAVGGMLSLLPHRWVYAGAAAAFLAGAVLLWRHKGGEGDDDTRRDGVRETFWPVAGTAFAVVFLAEFGDLTQITTVSLTARFHDPIAVGIGATAGLWTAAGLAVIVGWRLLRLIRFSWLTKIAAVIMLALAGTTAYAAMAA
ncbi:MAG: TMEM165/GDT1 family protein [Actinobacteria bacterium]|nr:TMEM165/GDT1 family protein [Actinomycetota bacterium]